MSKQIVQILENCRDCPWVELQDECICHNVSPDREIENPDKIPDWCPLEDAR